MISDILAQVLKSALGLRRFLVARLDPVSPATVKNPVVIISTP
jgi:hypothetical protein